MCAECVHNTKIQCKIMFITATEENKDNLCTLDKKYHLYNLCATRSRFTVNKKKHNGYIGLKIKN